MTADSLGPAAAVVQDAGYTEIAPGSFTVVALQRS
ncbi:peptidyl-tRNA hydrolase [Corynebacterium variabile]